MVQSILLRLNAEQPRGAGSRDFGAVIARYEQEEMPERYSTKATYQSYIKNQIRPRWENTSISAIKPLAVEDWLKNLTLAPKTKSHVRSLMHTIFSVCGAMGTDRQEPDQAGSGQGWHQALENAAGARSGTVPRVVTVTR